MQSWTPTESDVRELEVRSKSLPRGRLRGYARDQVDAFLVGAFGRIHGLFEENQGLRSGVSPTQLWFQPTGRSARLTPFDVQAKTFEVRFGGYLVRAIDEYLDEVTEILMALVAENESLRRKEQEQG